MSVAAEQISNRLRNELLAAVHLTRVTNGVVHVAGVPVCPVPPLDSISERALSGVTAALYTSWYAQWQPPSEADWRMPEMPSVIGVVRAWHAATPQFETGWLVQASDPSGGAVAIRGTDQRWLEPLDYVNLARPAAPVRPGDSVAVTRRRDSASPEDGWWFTWGSSGPQPTDLLFRIYWNANPAFLGPLVGALTTVMEDASVPYLLKCPAAKALFGRCDAVVLYLPADTWPRLRGDLRSAWESVAASLRPQTPPLALPLAPGVAIAEDPGNGRSFGESRSRAVADGLLHAFRDGLTDAEAILASVMERLSAHGIRPGSPHLRPGSPVAAIDGW